MDRKKAIIAAATVAGSLLAMSSAYALTSGIVGNGSDDGAGNLTPVLDQGPTETSPTSAPAGPQGARQGDGHDVEDRLDDRHDDDDEHEAVEPHDFEGRDDDD